MFKREELFLKKVLQKKDFSLARDRLRAFKSAQNCIKVCKII